MIARTAIDASRLTSLFKITAKQCMVGLHLVSITVFLLTLKFFSFSVIHFRSILDQKARSYCCRKCQATFEWYSSLQVHLKSHDDGKGERHCLQISWDC